MLTAFFNAAFPKIPHIPPTANSEEPTADSVKPSARPGASAARLLNIIALCNSLGLCVGIAGAACIRCGYVKLLGVSFVGVIFCLRAMAMLLATALGCARICVAVAMCLERVGIAKGMTIKLTEGSAVRGCVVASYSRSSLRLNPTLRIGSVFGLSSSRRYLKISLMSSS